MKDQVQNELKIMRIKIMAAKVMMKEILFVGFPGILPNWLHALAIRT